MEQEKQPENRKTEIKQKIWTSIFLFILMMGLFLYYQESGFFQHDMVEFAMYAEYEVLNQYDSLYPPYFSTVIINGFPWRTGTNYVTTGIFFLLHNLGISSEQTTMWVQFLFGSLAIVLLYLFLLELYENQTGAVIGALVFGLSTPLFNAVLSKEHGTEFFFAFLAMYLLLVGIKRKENRTAFFFSASCALGFLLWMRESGLFFPIIFYGFFLIETIEFNLSQKEWKINKEILTIKNCCILVLPYFILAAIAFYMYVWMILNVGLQKSTGQLFAALPEIIQSLKEWYPLLFFVFLGISIFLGFLKKEKEIFFFSAMIILFILLFSKNETFDLRHLAIYVFFPAVIIISYGIDNLLKKWTGWQRTGLLFLAGMLCVQMFLPGVSLFEQRKAHIYTKEFSEGITSVVPEENSVIYIQKDFCLFVEYYGKRVCQGIPDDFFTAINAKLAEGKRVFVFYQLGFGFYSDDVKTQIEQKYMLTEVYSGKFENYHHADLKSQVYNEMLIEVKSR